MPGPPALLHRRDRAAGGSLRAGETHRGKLVVHHVRADLAFRPVHPLLNLGQELVDQHRPLRPFVRGQPGLAQRDIVGDGLVVTSGQRGRCPKPAGQVVRLQNLHDLLAGLQPGPPCSRRRSRRGTAGRITPPPPGGDMHSMGRTHGRQWGDFVTASGDISWPPMGRIPWPPTASAAASSGCSLSTRCHSVLPEQIRSELHISACHVPRRDDMYEHVTRHATALHVSRRHAASTFTPKRSLVQSQYRPHAKTLVMDYLGRSRPGSS
jgi:hypothetical protein